MSPAYKLVAETLKTACSAFQGGVNFGKVLDATLPVENLINGYPARVHVAVGPDVVICRVIHTGRDGRTFDAAAKPLLDFVAQQMRGWKTTPNSCGTGEGKVFWAEQQFRPHQPPTPSHRYRDVFDAVMSARTACVMRKPFKQSGEANWQSAYMDNGVYPVRWTVEADGNEVVVRIKNRGSDSDAFWTLTHWMFGCIEKQHTDGRGRQQPRGALHKIFSDTLRLEVPCN